MTDYLIDSNIFIVSNRRYKREFFPIIWNLYVNNDNFYIIDKVFNELESGGDDLSKWIYNNYSNHVINAETSVTEYQKVVQYVQKSGYWGPAGYEEWISKSAKADPWIVSVALHRNMTIVTDEKNTNPSKGVQSTQEPKIPFVAEQMNVKTVNFWDFLKEIHFVAK